MADKLLLLTMFVMLTLPGLGFANRVPLWLTVLVISRDVAIVLTVAIVNLAVTRRTFAPSFLGKVATATYILTGVVTLYENYRGAVVAAGARRSSMRRSRSRSPRARTTSMTVWASGAEEREGVVSAGYDAIAIFFLKYAIVDVRPSSSVTFGSQPSSVRARVMSGWRTFGSSVGSGLKTSRLFDPVILMMQPRHVGDRHLVRVADVDRVVRRRLHQPQDARRPDR